MDSMRRRFSIAGLILAGSLACAHAQWLNYQEARTPRTHDGKPNLAAAAPRMNGRPDLSGVWRVAPESDTEWKQLLGPHALDLQIDLEYASRYAVNVLADFKPGEEPLRPVAPKPQTPAPKEAENPCLPDSVPFAGLVMPVKILQTPMELVILSESKSPHRQIYTDGRNLPDNPQPSWMGYSVGHWQRDTLVVETNGFRDVPLDAFRHPRSESMRIVERYRRRDFGHMDLETTIEDSKYYTRPFTIKVGLELIPDSDIQEYVCVDNERDRSHMDK